MAEGLRGGGEPDRAAIMEGLQDHRDAVADKHEPSELEKIDIERSNEIIKAAFEALPPRERLTADVAKVLKDVLDVAHADTVHYLTSYFVGEISEQQQWGVYRNIADKLHPDAAQQLWSEIGNGSSHSHNDWLNANTMTFVSSDLEMNPKTGRFYASEKRKAQQDYNADLEKKAFAALHSAGLL